jgi:hypothetical protein
MSEHYPRIRRYNHFEGEKYLWIRECVRIAFYMRRDHPEVVQAVMRSLESYLRRVGPQALCWYGDYDGEWQPLDEKGWAFIRGEFLHARGANISLTQAPEQVTGHDFTYRGRLVNASPSISRPNDTCAVTFWLPTEFLEEHGPRQVRELALELGAGLPFSSGNAGLCYQFPERLLGVTPSIREECFRYPGIDLANSDIGGELGTRVPGVHWLTFLGSPVLEALGGVESLRARLHSPGTTVQTLDDERAVVTLGSWPEAGDQEEGRTLPEYRELARVLEPWLYEETCAWQGFSPEDMRRWNRRFLD